MHRFLRGWVNSMLVITRKSDESIVITDNNNPDCQITISVLGILKDKVRLGIDAPKNIVIIRNELKELESMNKQAAQRPNPAMLEQLLQKKG